MDNLTPEQRHKCMSHIHSSDTKPEVFFRKALWKWGIRYRKNVKGLFGTPDIAIKKYKIVIFIDGDFWHGNDWKKKHFLSQEALLSSYSDYWQKKIRRNIKRDKKVKKYYKNIGWTILRFWTSETEKNLNKCITKTIVTINKIKDKVVK
ncbi:MAG: very short patch repair endonuclease [Spirochaetaceae bacterium]|jgi:DNA mismatch endonuclease (patch repair protein)|nr:very short patch repair endonuclease [Spirochaetaceae bacterium]